MHSDRTLLLRKEYGIEVVSERKVTGGWCADAFRVTAREGDFFLKVYDKQRPSVRPWIERMDAYMPVVLWLHGSTPLREHMVCPLRTGAGSYKTEDERWVYLLFPFVEGVTLGDGTLTTPQIRELAHILAVLHRYGEDVPVATDALRESFDTSFCAEIESGFAALPVVAPYRVVLDRATDLLRQTAAGLQRDPPALALCHADLHGWNLMQSPAGLVLVDWEGLLLAPVEADLFVFSPGYFYDATGGQLLKEYQAAATGYRANPRALRYYQLRRRLTDVFESMDSMRYDGLPVESMRKSEQDLLRECRALARELEHE